MKSKSKSKSKSHIKLFLLKDSTTTDGYSSYDTLEDAADVASCDEFIIEVEVKQSYQVRVPRLIEKTTFDKSQVIHAQR